MNSAPTLHRIMDKEDWRLEEIKSCLEQDSSSINEVNSYGETPLLRVLCSWSCPSLPSSVKFSERLLDVVKLLLNHGSDVNIRDDNDSTCLDMLYCYSLQYKKDILQLLIKKGLGVNALDREGRSPLCHALRDGHELCVILLLLNAGGSLDACKKHASPLHCAAESRILFSPDRKLQADVVEMLLKFVEKVAGKFEDPTPLQIGLQCGRWETKAVELFLDRFKDVSSVKDQSNNTLLHLAMNDHFCKLSVVKLLIKRGVKVDTVNNSGDTALHVCVSRYSPQKGIVKLLLESGSPVNVKNTSGENPLQKAAKYKNIDGTLKLLLIAGAQIGTTGYSLLKSILDKWNSSLQSEIDRIAANKILVCFKMLVKCYFLENPDFDLQSLIQDHKDCEELSRFRVDCLSQLRKLDSINIGQGLTLREFLGKHSSDQLPAATDFSPLTKSCNFNRLLEIIEENACPLFSDIIAGKFRKLSMEKLQEVEVYVMKCFSGQEKRVTLNYECVCEIAKHLQDVDLLRFISAFNKRDFEDKKNADTSEECRKRPTLQVYICIINALYFY